MKINIITLGCSKNTVDSENLAGHLRKAGFEIYFNGEPTHAATQSLSHSATHFDIVIINTCGFIGDAQEESIDTILEYAELRKQGKIKKLYVTGCLSQRFKKDLQAEIHEVDAFYGVESVNLIAADLLKEEVQPDYCSRRVLSTPSHYAYIKISEGCNRRCAFCAIPLIRGGHVSVPMDNLIEEARGLAKQGVKELILIAQDLTYYGHDIDGKSHIVELVKALADIDGFEWIRLHYGYPLGFPDELLDLMRENPKICHYIDLPLQHISTHILKDMRRGVDREQTIGFVKNVRKHVPDIAFRTTFIVGFPGETEEDFVKTLEICSRAAFDAAFTFQYSIRPGTKAAEFPDQIPSDVVTERFGRLTKLTNSLSEASCKRLVGQKKEVLIEGISKAGGGVYSGRTISNHLVNFTFPDEIRNSGSFCEDSLEGRLCEVDIQYARPYSVDGVMERFTDGK
jgi:ribosomal protein S12 methylthiotransferase